MALRTWHTACTIALVMKIADILIVRLYYFIPFTCLSIAIAYLSDKMISCFVCQISSGVVKTYRKDKKSEYIVFKE